MTLLRIIKLGAVLMLLTACNEMPSFESFKSQSPKLDIRDYFNGDIGAWGFIQNRKGEVVRRFSVAMNGSWDNDTCTLTEDFVFDNGEKQRRVWTFTMVDDAHFTGTASDVIGTAEGRQEGNAINLKYVLRIPVKNTTYDIKINDWLILLDEKRLMNISRLSKFGFTVGRLTIFFERQ